MFSFGPQTPKLSYEEAMENRAKVKSTLRTFVTVAVALRVAPFVIDYVKDLL
ncbi:hypothetical protein BC832DRAFT_590542 [Gaertneriomyces semiglobifer]|nr:hypothetical protein BC832DRAFT_590542 [Gaertneriomyces semiglobifer]